MALFSGDTKRLRELTAGVGRLKRGWQPRLMRVLAVDALALTQECFESSSDPYGRPWEKLKARTGQPLLDTGRLRNSLRALGVQSKGFRVVTRVKYAALHNYGGTVTAKKAPYLRFKVAGRWVSKKSVTIPRRQFIPDTGKTPQAWAEQFEETARAFIAREAAHVG
jgi:phage gpG-like protein